MVPTTHQLLYFRKKDCLTRFHHHLAISFWSKLRVFMKRVKFNEFWLRPKIVIFSEISAAKLSRPLINYYTSGKMIVWPVSIITLLSALGQSWGFSWKGSNLTNFDYGLRYSFFPKSLRPHGPNHSSTTILQEKHRLTRFHHHLSRRFRSKLGVFMKIGNFNEKWLRPKYSFFPKSLRPHGPDHSSTTILQEKTLSDSFPSSTCYQL